MPQLFLKGGTWHLDASADDLGVYDPGIADRAEAEAITATPGVASVEVRAPVEAEMQP